MDKKWLCLGALGVSALMLLLFLVDLIAGFPFSAGVPEGSDSPFMLFDIFGMLAAAILVYLSFNAFRDVK